LSHNDKGFLFLREGNRVTKRLIITAVTWLAALAALAQAGMPAYAQAAPYESAANKALAWIKTQQQTDGSFAGFGAGSTLDAVLAIVAANLDPTTYVQGGNNPITFLESKAGALAAAPGGAGKLLIVAHAIGRGGESFGVDLGSTINASYGISATGQYGPDGIGHAFSILGLSAAGLPVPEAAVDRLLGLQGAGGGWAFSGDTSAGSADTNTTAVALQALVAVGADKTNGEAIKRAVSYITAQQNSDGGWPYQQGSEFGSDSDVNSTSYVVQAMLALKNTMLAEAGQRFIASLQKPGGAFPYSQAVPDDSPGATYQAIPALLGATLINPRGEAGATIQPGMPVTGAGHEWAYLAALLAFAMLLSGASMALRRTR
jgi:hypothetical protein